MLNILKDDLSEFAGRGPAFVAFGETMVRDTPADLQRLEMARQVHPGDDPRAARHPQRLHHTRAR